MAEGTSPALKQLQALAFDPARLGLGPHGMILITEIIRAGRGRCWLAVVVLCAAFADIVTHEGADSLPGSGDADSGAHTAFGLSFLTAEERRALDRLRAARNRIVHYNGPAEGLGSTGQDSSHMAAEADTAIAAILPLITLQEMF